MSAVIPSDLSLGNNEAFDVGFELYANSDLTIPADSLVDNFRVGFRREDKSEGFDLVSDLSESSISNNMVRFEIAPERWESLPAGIYNFEVYNDGDKRVIVRGQLRLKIGIVPYA